jgi:hypothetical protein
MPKIKWTYERCKEDALQYNTVTGWVNGSGSRPYNACRENGWKEECCSHMISSRKPNGYWTKDNCIQDALQYDTKSEWNNGYGTGYKTSCENGWKEECCSHMKNKEKKAVKKRDKKKYDTESIREYFRLYNKILDDDFEYIHWEQKVRYWCIDGGHYNIKPIKEMIHGSKGCGKCSSVTTEKVIERFSNCGLEVIDGFKYRTGEPIRYWCTKGHYYESKWANFKDRCGKCNKNPEYSTESIKDLLSESGLYVYDEEWEYTNNKSGIPIECERGHRTNTITLNNLRLYKFTEGCNGCKICSIAYKNLQRFILDSELTLYCVRLKFPKVECIKFGITRHTVLDRFKKDCIKYNLGYDVLFEYKDIPETICYIEADILAKLKGDRVKGIPRGFGGYTECYDISYSEALGIWNNTVLNV